MRAASRPCGVGRWERKEERRRRHQLGRQQHVEAGKRRKEKGKGGDAGSVPGAGLTPRRRKKEADQGEIVGLRAKMREEFFLFSFQSQTNFQTNLSIDSNILSYSIKNGKFC